MKRLAVLFMVPLFMACATAQQRSEVTHGITFETGQSREAVMDVIVQFITREGLSIDTINEKYGIINTRPQIILTGELMKKVGEPGGGWIGTNPNMTHDIEFSATVSQTGTVHLKAMAHTVQEENPMDIIFANPRGRRSRAIDVFRTTKLNAYYAREIQLQLGAALIK